MWAALNGKLDCLEHLVAKGANLEATDNVSAALCQPPPAPSAPRPPPSLPAAPAAPPGPSPPPLTGCGRLRRTAARPTAPSPVPPGRLPPPPPSLPAAEWQHGVGLGQAGEAHGGRQVPGEPRRLLRSTGRLATRRLHSASHPFHLLRPVPNARPIPKDPVPVVPALKCPTYIDSR